MPTGSSIVNVHAVIVGGGAAGLWTLDACRRAGLEAVLLESASLGEGQTLWSQGIIHGGLKYTLSGLMTDDAREIRDMPGVWRSCLAGRAEPDLSAVTERAPFCHLWRTDDLKSRLGMVGARSGLRVKPEAIGREAWPEALAGLAGEVFRLDEQVIDPASLLGALRSRHLDRIVRTDTAAMDVAVDRADRVCIRLAGGPTIGSASLLLTAGLGNPDLRMLAGLDGLVMQRRPLHMLMVRGALPPLNGHCVSGGSTRVTITTARDAHARAVWQVGGQIAEDGTALDAAALIARGRAELDHCLGGFDVSGASFGTYAADRAEVRTPSGARPPTAYIHEEGRVMSAWPTKLALVPRLAERLVDAVRARAADRSDVDGRTITDALAGLDRPEVAVAPWDLPADVSGVTWTA